MRNISDIIEHHLKEILKQSQNGFIEIQRSEIAQKFQCVPSQINYVISTRFSTEKGYIIESKRGGGGYIRIHRVKVSSLKDLFHVLVEMIGQKMSQQNAEDILIRLLDEGLITERECRIMKAAVSREVLSFELQVRDQVRAALMRAMVTQIFINREGETP